MNQTGVRSTGSRREALTSRGFGTSGSLAFRWLFAGRQLPVTAEADRPSAVGARAEDIQLQRWVSQGQLLRAVAVQDRDRDRETALAHRQAREVQPQPLELRGEQEHAVDALRPDLPPRRAAGPRGPAT